MAAERIGDFLFIVFLVLIVDYLVCYFEISKISGFQDY